MTKSSLLSLLQLLLQLHTQLHRLLTRNTLETDMLKYHHNRNLPIAIDPSHILDLIKTQTKEMILLKRHLLKTRIGTILDDISTMIRSNTLHTDSLHLIYDQAVNYTRSRYLGIPSSTLHTIIRDAMNIDTAEEPWTTTTNNINHSKNFIISEPRSKRIQPLMSIKIPTRYNEQLPPCSLLNIRTTHPLQNRLNFNRFLQHNTPTPIIQHPVQDRLSSSTIEPIYTRHYKRHQQSTKRTTSTRTPLTSTPRKRQPPPTPSQVTPTIPSTSRQPSNTSAKTRRTPLNLDTLFSSSTSSNSEIDTTTTSTNSTITSDNVLSKQDTTPINHFPTIQTPPDNANFSLSLEEITTDSSLDNLLEDLPEISLLSPKTIPEPQPQRTLRRSTRHQNYIQCFPNTRKSSWTIPKIITQSQLWIGDSNISRLTNPPFQQLPRCNTALLSYSGAKITNLLQIISSDKFKHPLVDDIFFNMGINDCNRNFTPNFHRLSRDLHLLLAVTKRQFPNATINFIRIPTSSKLYRIQTSKLNALFQTIPNTTYLDIKLNTNKDGVHFNSSSIETIQRLILSSS